MIIEGPRHFGSERTDEPTGRQVVADQHAGDERHPLPRGGGLECKVGVGETRAPPRIDRLVYGGHTIGLAAAQASRAIPEIATIIQVALIRSPRPGARGRNAAQRGRAGAP